MTIVIKLDDWQLETRLQPQFKTLARSIITQALSEYQVITPNLQIKKFAEAIRSGDISVEW